MRGAGDGAARERGALPALSAGGSLRESRVARFSRVTPQLPGRAGACDRGDMSVMGRLGMIVMASCGWAACLITPVMSIGSGSTKSAKEVQHDRLGKLYPAQLVALHTEPGAVRTAKIRVWADDDYRAQNVRWQHGFDEQLDYVNQVLIPMLGVKVEPEYRAWPHHAAPGSALAETLDALAQHDPGEDVAWVVGLTSSLNLVSGSFDQLGVASLGEPHLVIRGHAHGEERAAFERAFPSIGSEVRDQAVEARRRHKTAAVLLHEMAHSLGALHETEPDWVMNAAYTHRAASISERNRELMRIALDDRLRGPSERDPRATARHMLTALEVGWGGWANEDRELLMSILRGRVGTQASVGESGEVPAAIAEPFRHAEALLARGDGPGAHATLEPLLAAYPAHTKLRLLDCRIELARGGVKDPKATATCTRAASLSTEVEPAIAVAALWLAAGDAAGAHGMLAAAETRVSTLPAAQAAQAWLTLADAYRQLGALTSAERALASGSVAPGADRGISAWAATTRVRYGVPRDGRRYKLAASDEAAAVTAVRAIVALVNATKFADATRAAAAAEARWPGLPGVVAARCDLALRRNELAAARALCSRASAQGSSWALYLSGILELRGGGTAKGIAQLRAAIALDPELGQAWRSLGKALDRAQATAELAQLRQDYQARFGTALPR